MRSALYFQTGVWAAGRDVAITHLENLEALAGAYLGDRSGVEEIDRDELARRLDDGDLIGHSDEDLST